MNFKHSNIDIKNSSIEDIKEEINRLKKIKNDNENLQMALKLFINSAYGGIGNQYFQCYNPDVAEAITLQGQDILKYIANCTNKYFENHWHKDKKLHNILGVTVNSEVTQPVVIAGDTDSIFLSFGEVFSTIKDFDETKFIELIKLIYTNRLKEYFTTLHEKYAEKWNTENLQDFEMEKIAFSGIWVAKKHYVLNIAWKEGGKDGIYYPSEKNIVAKGVEIAQGSYPEFIRVALKELVSYIFKNHENFNTTEFLSKIKALKDLFKLKDVESICISKNINNYSKYILNDRSAIELASKCPVQLKAAAIYNYKLTNSKYKDKYSLIKDGSKIKFYYVKGASKEMEVFGFIPNNFPAEIAPAIDIDTTFTKSVLNPLNSFMEAIGKQPIPANLVYVRALW